MQKLTACGSHDIVVFNATNIRKTIRVTEPSPPAKSNSVWSVAALAVVAAFGTYFCMYAFRKPFAVAKYTDCEPLWGVSFKTVLVVAQVLGYMVSKFVGIRTVAEVLPSRRVRTLLTQIGFAEVSLLLFALTPPPFNAIWLFSNGFFLGMIFGLVMGFLEGRRNTEALLAALCASFILADGVVKSVGSWLMEDCHVPQMWMPFAAGLLFVPPLLFFCAILRRVPPPDAADIAARTERTPMTAADRRRFLKRYGFGLVLIVFVFLLVTILRSVRADFAREIWEGLGVDTQADPSLFTRSELLVAAIILPLYSSISLIRNNRTAFFTGLGLAFLGFVLSVLVVQAWQQGSIAAFPFMVLLGLGLYSPYIAVHTTIFERFIALTRDRGTIGYLMYLADSFAYLGYVAVLLSREIVQYKPSEGILPFFLMLCTSLGIVAALMLIPAALYFRKIRSV
ncbi:DUF5690 family protein [soil metagenome]